MAPRTLHSVKIMASFRHLFITYLRRFRVELGLWAALTLSASMLALNSTASPILAATARTEGLAALWVLLRICLADEAFGTLAGKRTRPIARGTALAARLVLLLAAFLPPLLARAFVWSRWASPDADGWLAWCRDVAVPLVLQLVMIAVLLQGLAGLARSSVSRRLAPLMLLGVCGLSLLWLANRWIRETRSDPFDFHKGRIKGRTEVTAPLFHALPEGATILSDPRHVSPYNWPDAQPAIEIIRRLSLAERRPERSADGIEWRIHSIESKGDMLELELGLRGLPTRLEAIESTYLRPRLLVRFNNGEFGVATDSTGKKASSPLSLCPLDEVRLKCRFLTPLVRAWNRATLPELLEGAELWVLCESEALVPTPSAQPVRWTKTPIRREEWQGRQLPPNGALVSNQDGSFLVEPVLPKEEDSGLAAEVDGVMSMLRDGRGDVRGEPPFVAELRSKGRRIVPHLLRWPAWSGAHWKLLVRPTLLEHAVESDLPELVARLEREPRLIEVFAAKGWHQEARPVIERRAAAGLGLPLPAIERLALEDNAITDETLADLSLLLTEGIERLAPVLRIREGFDWSGFALRGWMQRKYGTHRGNDWIYALWAAEVGDRSALERIIQGAALGRKWEIEHLRQLIPDAPENLMPFLRAHRDKLTFEVSTGIWRVQK